MKQLITLILCFMFSVSSFSKDLHFIYVRFDSSMDTEVLKVQIEKLKNSLSTSDFIVFYSNENTTMNNESWDRDKLFGQISSQNSSISISIPDELESISVPLEKQLQEESYSTIYLECFVGNSFFDNNFQDTLLARMLLVNSFVQSKYNFSIQYYPCGANYNEKQIKFNSEYNIHLKTKIITSL